MIAPLTVNGTARLVQIAPNTRLIDVLRDQLHLTGTKQGCRSGECGACTVLVERKPMQACVMLASRLSGEVFTIEGLDDRFAPLRHAFADTAGFQCGFCTPGQLMRAAALLMNAPPELFGDETWLRQQMNGNICRCTGYSGIIRALMSEEVRTLARDLQQSAGGEPDAGMGESSRGSNN